MPALRNRLKKRSKPLRIDPSRFESLPSDEKETQLFEVAYQDTELARKLAACVVSQCFGGRVNGRLSPAQRAGGSTAGLARTCRASDASTRPWEDCHLWPGIQVDSVRQPEADS